MKNYLRAEKLGNSSRSYKGLNQTSGRTVVMKYLPYNESDVQYFRSLSQLAFPFLVAVLHVEVVDDYICVIEEYVENGSLRSLAGIINATLVHDILEKMLRAVRFLHENQIYHGAISVDNILVTKDLLPKLQMVGVMRLPTPLAGFPLSQADDIYLLGKFAFYLITGESLDSIEDAEDDLRITPDIQAFLRRVVNDDVQKIPSLYTLYETDKYVRKLLGMDKQEMVDEFDALEQSVHETTTSYAQSVRYQLMQSIASSYQKYCHTADVLLDETTVDNVFLLKMNSSQTDKFSFDDDDLTFYYLDGYLQIMTAQVQDKKLTYPSGDFDDDADVGFQEVQCQLRVNTLETKYLETKQQDSCADNIAPDDDSDEIGVPAMPLKVKFSEYRSQLNNLIIDDVDSNFGLDAEKKFGSMIQKKHDYDSPHMLVTPAVPQFYSSSLRPRELDDDLDDQFDGLDDKNADLFASVAMPTQQPQRYFQLDFFDDDQGDNSLNFDDDYLVYKLEQVEHLGFEVAEQLAYYKYLCEILYLRRCHEQQYQDKTIDAIIQRANLADYVIKITNNLYRFQSNDQVLYFIRVVTLLMYLSKQFVFVMLFYQNILSALSIKYAVGGVVDVELNQFYPNYQFDAMSSEQKVVVTHCNYLNTIVSYLIENFKDKGDVKLQYQCFDLFTKQDGVEYLLNYILCYDTESISEKSVKLPIFGFELFQALLRKYCEFRVDLYYKLAYQRPVENIMGRLLGFLLQIDLERQEYDAFRYVCISFLLDYQQSAPTMLLSGIIEYLSYLTVRYESSEPVLSYLLDFLLVISKAFDDQLQSELCRVFGEQLQHFCMRFGANRLYSTNKLVQSALLILMNVAFSSDARRRMLCTEPLIEALSIIARESPVLRQMAISLLLELLKIPIEIKSYALLERLSCICAEALGSYLFVLLAAQLLNRWQTINLAEVQKFLPPLQKSDFEHISSAALAQLEQLFVQSPLLAQVCFNKSLQRRCYLALAEENSTILAALGIVLQSRHLLRHPAIQKFCSASAYLMHSANQHVKNQARRLYIELSGVADYK